jgi:RcsF protein
MKKSILVKLVYISLFSLFLSACASRYEVSTNLDSKHFKSYFSPTKVTIYKNEQSMLADLSPTSNATIKNYRYIGSVEGEDCQTQSHHQAPDEINARTHARRSAFELGANAIIFSGCALIENNEADKHCLATTVCYGKAYHLRINNND